MPPDRTENHENSDTDGPEAQRPSGRGLLIGLTLALAAWGIYHAIGVFFGGFGAANLSYDFRRSLVVLAAMGGFLGFCWLLLVSRRRSHERTDRTRPPI